MRDVNCQQTFGAVDSHHDVYKLGNNHAWLDYSEIMIDSSLALSLCFDNCDNLDKVVWFDPADNIGDMPLLDQFA
jgi:hypothetical protein